MQIDFARDPLLIRSVIKLEGRIVSLTPAALVFLALATSCFIISSLCLSKEVGEVNRKLPDDQQISYWGMYTSKRLKIKDQYRKLYPNGRLDRVVFLWEIAGFILVFFSAMSSGCLIADLPGPSLNGFGRVIRVDIAATIIALAWAIIRDLPSLVPCVLW
jgi:hypothetical protein